MGKLQEFSLNDEAEMRAFYEKCGISKRTTEAAVKVRRNNPVQQERNQRLRSRRPLRKSKDR